MKEQNVCVRCGKPATHHKIWGGGHDGLGQYIRLYYCQSHYEWDDKSRDRQGMSGSWSNSMSHR